MLATYACAVGICALSLAAGRLVCWLGGARGWTWLAPGAGLAALLCVATVAVRLPGTAGPRSRPCLPWRSAAWCFPSPPRRRGEPAGRRRANALEAAAVALIVLAAVSVPFAVSGRFGVLGAGINNDLGFHLAWSEALATGQDADALIGEVDPGYPIGPHSVAAALARPFDVLPAFTGFLMAVQVLTALTAFTALRDLRPAWRVAGAAATAPPYMAVSYFGQASYKEPALALLVLVFALSLSQLRPPSSWRAGLVPGLAAVAAVLIFGQNSVAWPLGIVGVWLAAELVVRRREWLPWLRGIAPALLAIAGVLIAGALTNLPRLEDAGWTSSVDGEGDSGPGGNFVGQISPWRVFGGWPSPAFQLPATHDFWVGVATVIAVTTVAYAAVWWTRRRELVLPASVLASLLIYFYARGDLVPYFSAKALVVAAPLIALLAVRAVFAGLPGPERPRSLASLSRTDTARALLGAAFLVVVAWSSLLALGYGRVSEHAHAEELRSLRPLLQGGPTILLDRDDYARWELLDVSMSNLAPYQFEPDLPVSPRPGKPGSPVDFDSLTGEGLDRFRYAVTVRGPYASAPPENWRLVRGTPSFEVWERIGPTPRRATLAEGDAPGAILDCATPDGRELSRLRGVAAVRPTPAVGSPTGWRGPAGAPVEVAHGTAIASPGTAVTQALATSPRALGPLASVLGSALASRARRRHERGYSRCDRTAGAVLAGRLADQRRRSGGGRGSAPAGTAWRDRAQRHARQGGGVTGGLGHYRGAAARRLRALRGLAAAS